MLNSGVSLGTFEYDDGSVTFFVEDDQGAVYDISKELHQALLRADGTKPLDLPNQGEDIIPELEELELIRTGRFARCEGTFNCFTLFPIGNRANRFKPICNVIGNKLLPFISLLAFVVGIVLKLCITQCLFQNLFQNFHFGLYLISVIVATILHEIGHIASGIGYDYSMTDAGILLLGIFPVGGYVAADAEQDESKPLFHLAGILQNMLLCGACFIGSILSCSYKTAFEMGAFVNLLMAGMNLLLPISGLDGEACLSAALGIKSISYTSRRVLQNKKHRKELWQVGIHGRILMGILVSNLISKIIFIICLAAYIIAILCICL